MTMHAHTRRAMATGRELDALQIGSRNCFTLSTDVGDSDYCVFLTGLTSENGTATVDFETQRDGDGAIDTSILHEILVNGVVQRSFTTSVFDSRKTFSETVTASEGDVVAVRLSSDLFQTGSTEVSATVGAAGGGRGLLLLGLLAAGVILLRRR